MKVEGFIILGIMDKITICKGLAEVGSIEVLSMKEVFTLLIKGDKMTSMDKVVKVGDVLKENEITTEYPLALVMKNEEDYILMVLGKKVYKKAVFIEGVKSGMELYDESKNHDEGVLESEIDQEFNKKFPN